MSVTLNQVQKVKTGRKVALPGHQQGAAAVALFAAVWTQLVAAVTLALMWFAWQDPRNLAWPETDRLILIALTLLTVLVVSLALSSRFRRRSAADRDNFREIWWTGGAATGTWFGLPLYMSVTWDHLIYGGHDIVTIISVGLIFMAVGGMLGGVVAVMSEPAARWIYDRVQNRTATKPSSLGSRLGWLLTPLSVPVGAVVTYGLLSFGPAPVADPLYPGAILTQSGVVAYGCQGTLDSYTTPDQPDKVLNFYRQLATNHKSTQVALPGEVQADRLVLPNQTETARLAVIRYSNTSFTSAAEAFDPLNDSCRSTRVFLQPDTTGPGTHIQIVHERPAHVH